MVGSAGWVLPLLLGALALVPGSAQAGANASKPAPHAPGSVGPQIRSYSDEYASIPDYSYNYGYFRTVARAASVTPADSACQHDEVVVTGFVRNRSALNGSARAQLEALAEELSGKSSSSAA